MVGVAEYKLEELPIISYGSDELDDDEKAMFNSWQSSTRTIVEQACGRLKGRFQMVDR